MNQATRIKIKLLIAGISQAELAREVGVGKVAIGLVIQGKRTSHRIMHHVARRLGCPVAELFGQKSERRRGERRRSIGRGKPVRRRGDRRKRGAA